MFLAVGGSTFEEINISISYISTRSEHAKIVVLFGYQAYPTQLSDNNLRTLKTLRDLFGGTVEYGFMDHTSGDDPAGLTLPSLALALGCEYIEKHVTDDRAKKG